MKKATEDKRLEFKGVVTKNVYDSPNFKAYAIDVDKQLYPFVKFNEYGNVKIVGELPELTSGVEYEIVATEEISRYGYSYRVVNIRRNVPTTKEGTIAFLNEVLSSEEQAQIVYDAYPDIIERVRESRLSDIDYTKMYGIGEKRFALIVRKITESFYLMDLVSEFGGILSLGVLKKIYEKYSSVDVLREKLIKEPYSSLTRISGIGFKTADNIIIELQSQKVIDFGYDIKTSLDRCLSCIIYILQENEKEGHTKINLAELRRQCYELVPACADHFVEAIKNENIYYSKETMSAALRKTYNAEEYIAKTIVDNLNNNNVWDFNIDKYRNTGEFDLSDEQMNALDNVCKHSISILNGFAGAGKSFTTQSIIAMLEDNSKTYKLFAPTGRAAKVLAGFTKREASTIHRGLKYVPPEWTLNKDCKLNEDIVIVDEFSMADVDLFKHLIDAIDFETTKLLLIGDSAQLPSVGCGNLLHDFMESGIIPTATLTKIFRYSSGGLMKVATDVRNGKQYLNKSMKKKTTVFGDNKDYVFMDLASEEIPIKVVALYKKLLDGGNKPEDILVLTAKNVGNYGAVILNNMIQKVANKNYGSKCFMKVGDTVYYKGDLVLQKINNYKAELFDIPKDKCFVANGEIGIIEEIQQTYAVINFDGVYVKYYRKDMNMISLGYAMSIHKSQGGSADNIILLTPQAHVFMENSNLEYVGLTRMRKRCYHLGSIQTVNMAIKKKANLTRHTFMQGLLINLNNKKMSQ